MHATASSIGLRQRRDCFERRAAMSCISVEARGARTRFPSRMAFVVPMHLLGTHSCQSKSSTKLLHVQSEGGQVVTAITALLIRGSGTPSWASLFTWPCWANVAVKNACQWHVAAPQRAGRRTKMDLKWRAGAAHLDGYCMKVGVAVCRPLGSGYTQRDVEGGGALCHLWFQRRVRILSHYLCLNGGTVAKWVVETARMTYRPHLDPRSRFA